MMPEFNPAPKLELGGEYITNRYEMRSAHSYVTDAIWKKHIGKSGKIWLTLANGSADMMLVEGGPNSRGFGGATLQCKLEDGTIQELTGPWSSNTESLFADTGIDLRNKIITWGVIGRWRDFPRTTRIDHRNIIGGLIEFDSEPTAGIFERIETRARELAYQRDEILFYYSQSFGGSSCGSVLPFEGTPGWDRRSQANWSRAKKLGAPYWERYYTEFPHLDHRRFIWSTSNLKKITQED